MIIVHPNPRTYEAYPVSPSAFEKLEWPLLKIQNEFLRQLSDFSDSSPLKSIEIIKLLALNAHAHFQLKNYSKTDEHLKEMFITTAQLLKPILKCTAVFYAGIALIPPVLCLTPVTLIMDLVSGAREIKDAYKQGYPKDRIEMIFKKKWVASASQHCSFFVINALFFHIARPRFARNMPLLNQYLWTVALIPLAFTTVLFTAVFVIALLTIQTKKLEKFDKTLELIALSFRSLHVYNFSVIFIVDYLPEWAKSDHFTIFNKQNRSLPDYQSLKKIDEEWQEYGESDRATLTRRAGNSEADIFINRFKDRAKIHKFLDIPENYNEEELKEAYKKWAKIFHPDKRILDGEILFKALSTANELAKEKFKKTSK